MQECSNPQAPNTCIPYILTLILILQRHLDIIMGQEEFQLETEEKLLTPQIEGIPSNKEKGNFYIILFL